MCWENIFYEFNSHLMFWLPFFPSKFLYQRCFVGTRGPVDFLVQNLKREKGPGVFLLGGRHVATVTPAIRCASASMLEIASSIMPRKRWATSGAATSPSSPPGTVYSYQTVTSA